MFLCDADERSTRDKYIEHIMSCVLCSESHAEELYSKAVAQISAGEYNIQYAIAMVIAANL